MNYIPLNGGARAPLLADSGGMKRNCFAHNCCRPLSRPPLVAVVAVVVVVFHY